MNNKDRVYTSKEIEFITNNFDKFQFAPRGLGTIDENGNIVLDEIISYDIILKNENNNIKQNSIQSFIVR